MENTIYKRLLAVFLCLVTISFISNAGGKQDANISIGPNPFTKELNIENLPVGAKTVVLENEYGHVVQAYFTTEENFTINEDLSPGVYILKIDVNNHLFVYRVTKR